jgi:phosphohistidine swiveling domain-containing protein
MDEKNNIETIVANLMEKEDRKDSEFRFALLSTEIGDIGKYITHDPKLNPGARPHGSKEDEKLAYGQAIVMLMGLCYARGISYDNALNLGINNWQEADWRKRESSSKEVKGFAAVPYFRSGDAYVVSEKNPLSEMKTPGILVMEFAKPDFVLAKEYILGIVTDHGGSSCHAANIAREYNIPCIVGTGNATTIINHGDRISLDYNDNNEGIVTILS